MQLQELLDLFLKKMKILFPNFSRRMFVRVIKMLQCKRVDISEAIDTNKTSSSKECMLCHYWCFKNIRYKFELNVCNKFHDVQITAYELINMATLNVKGVDYTCIL